MEDFNIFLNKYSNFNLADEYRKREEAEYDIQHTIISDLDDEIHENCLITLETDLDGTTINTDKLVMWLQDNYTVEPRWQNNNYKHLSAT